MSGVAETVGFIGLGSMGGAMALNLARAGTPLIVWNRSPGKTDAVVREGAQVAGGPDELFARARTVILMLATEAAIGEVLGRGGPDFAKRVRDRVIVQMGTFAPAFSKALETDIRAAGGSYVEAPVSGSRKPAEDGQLVAMLAGEPRAVDSIRDMLKPMCRDSIVCGEVPKALTMKLAVNILLLTTATGLAESVNFARRNGLDLDQLATVLNGGQMASGITRVKLPKLVERDFSMQAGIADVFKNASLIAEAARQSGVAAPLMDVCRDLYRETLELGHAQADMAAVVTALEERSEALS